jgi:hypothetical protein
MYIIRYQYCYDHYHLGLMGLPPITRNLTGSFLSSSHLSAFAQTPFSTNRVTAGQQQRSFAQDKGSTSSFLPLSNQSISAQAHSTTTAGDNSSRQNQSSSNTTNNVPSNSNNTTK